MQRPRQTRHNASSHSHHAETTPAHPQPPTDQSTEETHHTRPQPHRPKTTAARPSTEISVITSRQTDLRPLRNRSPHRVCCVYHSASLCRRKYQRHRSHTPDRNLSHISRLHSNAPHAVDHRHGSEKGLCEQVGLEKGVKEWRWVYGRQGVKGWGLQFYYLPFQITVRKSIFDNVQSTALWADTTGDQK